MARLHRVVKACDKLDTSVLTFMVPYGQDGSFREAVSPAFPCSGHRWSIALVGAGGHLGAYLTMLDAAPGLRCAVSYRFTLLSKLHYSHNEGFAHADAVFSSDQPVHGRKVMVAESEVADERKGFRTERRELLLELIMFNFRTLFEHVFRLPAATGASAASGVGGGGGGFAVETGRFAYGPAEWSIALQVADLARVDARNESAVCLRRHTNHDLHCSFRYRMHIACSPATATAPSTAAAAAADGTVGGGGGGGGKEQSEISSETLTTLFDDARTLGKLVLPRSVADIARRGAGGGQLRMWIECFDASVVSLLQFPLDGNKHRSLCCLDRDRQNWMVSAHTKSDWLTFQIFFDDIRKVPKGFSQVSHFDVSVFPGNETAKTERTLDSPFRHYYVQKERDEAGVAARTKFLTKHLLELQSQQRYLKEGNTVFTVKIEWSDSYLLSCTDYVDTDDIPRLHKMQLEKEMQLLQKENLELEKQVHSYQIALAARDNQRSVSVEHSPLQPKSPATILASSLQLSDAASAEGRRNCGEHLASPSDGSPIDEPLSSLQGAIAAVAAAGRLYARAGPAAGQISSTSAANVPKRHSSKDVGRYGYEHSATSTATNYVESAAKSREMEVKCNGYDVAPNAVAGARGAAAERTPFSPAATVRLHKKVHRWASDARSDAGYYSDRQACSERNTCADDQYSYTGYVNGVQRAVSSNGYGNDGGGTGAIYSDHETTRRPKSRRSPSEHRMSERWDGYPERRDVEHATAYSERPSPTGETRYRSSGRPVDYASDCTAGQPTRSTSRSRGADSHRRQYRDENCENNDSYDAHPKPGPARREQVYAEERRSRLIDRRRHGEHDLAD